MEIEILITHIYSYLTEETALDADFVATDSDVMSVCEEVGADFEDVMLALIALEEQGIVSINHEGEEATIKLTSDFEGE
jgi:hypothetical protein